MAWVEVGALSHLSPGGVQTKKALKAEIDSVQFYSVSPFNNFHGGWADIPAGTKLTVVGPSPHTNRKWYATVEVVNGKVKVT